MSSTSPPAPTTVPTPTTTRLSLTEILRYDAPASLVVFLVAVPLSLGIAVASGAPLAAGLISAAVGGIVAGLLGGSQLQVSGPAAGMVVIVAGLVSAHGWPTVAAITLAAGLLQICLGLLGAGRYAMAIPPAVVHGMLAGIGISIVLGQSHVLLGGKAHSEPLDNVVALPAALLDAHTPSVLLGASTLGLLVVWPFLPRAVKALPAPLAAIAAATAAGLATGFDGPRPELPSHLLSLTFAPRWDRVDVTTFLTAVVSVALLASIESLLSAVAVDRLHQGPRADLRRELIGQGVANAACGALGGLPVTGVIVRSSTNAMAGGRTRASAVLHGVWVLLAAALLASLIEAIPLAALAGLLIHVGAKLVNVAHVRELATHKDLAAYLVTIGGVLLVGLVEGVALGLVVAFWQLRRRASWHAVETTVDGRDAVVRVRGAVGFVAVPDLVAALEKVPHGAAAHLRLDVDYLDHAAVTVLTDWIDGHRGSGGSVVFDEVGEPWLSAADEGAPIVDRTSRPGAPLGGRRLVRGGSAESPTIAGLRAFHDRRDEVAPSLADLAETQSPTTMFITCCDSRVVPHLITSSGPGDLFVVRTVGNMVPDWDDRGDVSSVSAAIEYAVRGLGVEEIVICGHTGCAAMHGLLHGLAGELPETRRWLDQAGARVTDELHRHGAPMGADELARLNVLVQLDHLRTHPAVRRRPQLRLIGMVFDIAQTTSHVVAAGHVRAAAEAR